MKKILISTSVTLFLIIIGLITYFIITTRPVDIKIISCGREHSLTL